MADFNKIIGFIRKSEGGYVNDPKDRGGETYAGVSRKHNPTWAGWAIVDKHKPLNTGDKINDHTLEQAILELYRKNYWNAIAGDAIKSQAVANMLFDWQVNSGDIASKTVQRLVSANPDGVIGDKTVAAINNTANLLTLLKQARIDFYKNIAAKDPTQVKFLKGWLARVEAVPM